MRRPHVTEALAEAVTWLLKEINSLADQRNMIIHSGYMVMRNPDQSLVPILNPLSGPRALAAYRKTTLPGHIKYLRLKTEVLAKYAEAIFWALWRPGGPWPEKPLLPTLGQKTKRRDGRPRSQTKSRASKEG